MNHFRNDYRGIDFLYQVANADQVLDNSIS